MKKENVLRTQIQVHARPNSLARLLIDPALSPEKENVANNNQVIIATQIDDPISLRTATNLLLEFQDDYLVSCHCPTWPCSMGYKTAWKLKFDSILF